MNMLMLSSIQSQWANVIEHDGLVVAGVGLAIVFSSLTALSLGIAALPRILAWVHTWLPEGEKIDSSPDQSDVHKAAAAAIAIHHHRNHKG